MSNATPNAKGPQESPPETASAPADLIGWRPPGESSVGTIGLIRLTLATLRFNFWRLIVFTLYVGAVGFGLSLLVCCPLGITLKGHPLWLRYLVTPLTAPITIPLIAGYTYAVLLQVLGLKPKAKEVLRPIESGGLYLNVLAAGGVPYLGGWLLWTLASQLPWTPAETLVPGHPLVAQFLRGLAAGVPWILFLPFAFSAIHVLVARVPFTRALVRSFRFAVGHCRLFTGFLLLRVGASLLSTGAATPARFLRELFNRARGTVWGTSGPLLVWMVLVFGFLGGLLVVIGLLTTLIDALFYREFVWREREAGQASAAPLG
jgi:hypothetical protein